MRQLAFTAGLVLVSVIFVAGSPSVHAQAENDKQTVKTEQTADKKAESKKVEVEPGDYLAKIAKEHKTTYPRLYSANTQIKNPDVIYVGDKLRIPHADEKLEKRRLPADALPVASQAAPAADSRQRDTVTEPRLVPAAPAPQAASNGGNWDRLAACESGGNWSINTGNGYYGGLQFSLPSWRAVGGSGYPNQASKSEQIARAEMLQARQGWGAWPACTAKLGIR